jgi:hypothetical protein
MEVGLTSHPKDCANTPLPLHAIEFSMLGESGGTALQTANTNSLLTPGPCHNIIRQYKRTVYRIEKVTRTSYKTTTGHRNIDQEAQE